MNKPINFQTILGADGQPAFVVVPYADFIERFQDGSDLIPDAVVKLVFDQNMTPARAWREHLGLTQADMAQRLGISQSAYAQQENSSRLRKASREKIAAALGISPEQLDF
jgi:DNA-binding XRE family transcriptional regulator